MNPLKFIAKNIIWMKNKEKFAFSKKSKFAAFCFKFRAYLIKIMKIMLDRTDIEKGIIKSWMDYLNNSIFSLIGATDTTLMPQTPVPNKALDDWNLLNLLTFYKFSRPDMIHHCFQNFYPEIRSVKYSETPDKFSNVVHMNWYKRPTMVIYNKIYYDPVEKIQILAFS